MSDSASLSLESAIPPSPQGEDLVRVFRLLDARLGLSRLQPDAQQAVFGTVVRGLPNGTATLRIAAVLALPASSASPIRNGVMLTAELRTTADQRSLALLHLGGFYNQHVKMRLGMALNLATGRMDFFIKEVDEEDLIRRERPVQAILEGL